MAFRNAAVPHFQAAAGTLTLAVPTGLVVGDVLIAYILSADKAVGIGTPAGWTEFLDVVEPVDVRISIQYRIVTGGEDSSYGFTCGASTQGFMFAYEVDNVNPFDARSSHLNNAGGTVQATPDLVTGVNNVIVVGVIRTGNDVRAVASIGTERADQKADNETLSFWLADIERAVAGAGSEPSATYDASATGVFTLSFSLRQAGVKIIASQKQMTEFGRSVFYYQRPITE